MNRLIFDYYNQLTNIVGSYLVTQEPYSSDEDDIVSDSIEDDQKVINHVAMLREKYLEHIDDFIKGKEGCFVKCGSQCIGQCQRYDITENKEELFNSHMKQFDDYLRDKFPDTSINNIEFIFEQVTRILNVNSFKIKDIINNFLFLEIGVSRSNYYIRSKNQWISISEKELLKEIASLVRTQIDKYREILGYISTYQSELKPEVDKYLRQIDAFKNKVITFQSKGYLCEFLRYNTFTDISLEISGVCEITNKINVSEKGIFDNNTYPPGNSQIVFLNDS